jgi:small GTP-binding protein
MEHLAVGKTCLTLRFVKGTFDEDQLPTIGAAYMTKKVAIEDKLYIFEIWDTAGQERYEAMTPLYYRSAEAAVLVFDLGFNESFQKAKKWLKRLRKERPDPDMPIALVGNKVSPFICLLKGV